MVFLHAFILCVCAHACACVCRSENKSESCFPFSFHHVEPRDQTQAARLGGECLHPLGHLLALFLKHNPVTFRVKGLMKDWETWTKSKDPPWSFRGSSVRNGADGRILRAQCDLIIRGYNTYPE